jgi:uncharacterized protein YPO0396
MLDPQPLLFDEMKEANAGEATFQLTQLEVYNWGPFRGLHRADFHPAGTAIIGPTSSGNMEERRAFFVDGYCQKLNFKDHPLIESAKSLLAGRDLHCVATAEELNRVEHGLTIQGLISGKHGKFEKLDQRRLHEDWMTGFDNKDQLETLVQQCLAIQQSAAHWKSESEIRRRDLEDLNSQLKMIDALLSLDFAAIDLPAAQAELSHSQNRLQALHDPNSDAAQAKLQFERESEQLKHIEGGIRQLEIKIGVLAKEREDALAEMQKAERRIGRGLSDDERKLAQKDMAVAPDLTAKDVGDAERATGESIDKKLARHQEKAMDHEKRLVHLMAKAKQVDTGALAEVGGEVSDIPEYLERLRTLNEEALPEKRTRFLEYLNRSSDQGVTQLLAGIEERVDAIEQRLRDLNQTLVRVDFRSGRYLQLQPQRIKHERLRSLEAAMRKVRSAALKDDDGESHYQPLREIVEILREASDNRRQQGSRALLHPRYRLQFFVIEVDRQSGSQSPPRTGSQSGSGGEKELMASHILTALLSYALFPAGANRPLYGTVILDEAFSKSSPSAATRIVEALRIFGLNPIFVTPNKEISLLRQHTRRVICVQRLGKEATLASISWERLAEIARPQ